MLQLGRENTASGKAVLVEPSVGPGCSLPEPGSAGEAAELGLILFA